MTERTEEEIQAEYDKPDLTTDQALAKMQDLDKGEVKENWEYRPDVEPDEPETFKDERAALDELTRREIETKDREARVARETQQRDAELDQQLATATQVVPRYKESYVAVVQD